jgi:hypothetical protein
MNLKIGIVAHQNPFELCAELFFVFKPYKQVGRFRKQKIPPTMWKGFWWSGWQDSNLRPPAPKAGAITGLRYTPQKKINFSLRGCKYTIKISFTKPNFK